MAKHKQRHSLLTNYSITNYLIYTDYAILKHEESIVKCA
jgi:hypothetical protein